MTNKRHPHYECIVAWAEGKEIEWNRFGVWVPCGSNPNWCYNVEYRIKPEKKPDIVKYGNVHSSFGETNLTIAEAKRAAWSTDGPGQQWGVVKYVFDGDTGKLKEVTVVE